MELKLNIKNTENIGDGDTARYEEIVTALIQAGALDGVKGGKAIIHFDDQGIFRGVQLDYWPFRKRHTS